MLILSFLRTGLFENPCLQKGSIISKKIFKLLVLTFALQRGCCCRRCWRGFGHLDGEYPGRRNCLLSWWCPPYEGCHLRANRRPPVQNKITFTRRISTTAHLHTETHLLWLQLGACLRPHPRPNWNPNARPGIPCASPVTIREFFHAYFS